MNLLVHDVWTWIDGYYQQGLLDPVTSYLLPGRFFIDLYKKGKWDGRVRFVKRHSETKQYYFPTGLLARVQKFLRERSVPHSISDYRNIEPCQNDPIYAVAGKCLDVAPYDYQAEAVDACLINGRGIIQCATGAGKTIIGAAVLKTLDEPSIWLTHRLNLAYQTQKVLQKALGEEIGFVGDSQIEYQKHTIGMAQSLCSSKHKEFLKTRKVIIGDEIHHLESQQWYSNFASCPAPYRFGLSATPNLEGAGLNLLGMTGDVIYAITAKELIQRKVLCKPKIFFLSCQVPQASPKAKFAAVYKECIVDNGTRNAMIVETARVFQRQEQSCLTLVNRVQHGKDLTALMKRDNIRAEFVYGKTPKETREEMFEKLFSGQLDNIVATAPVVGEGSDFPALRALINATGGKGGGDASSEDESGRVTIQILGRGLRKFPGKETFFYVDFADSTHKFMKSASLDRIRTLKSEGYESFIVAIPTVDMLAEHIDDSHALLSV